MGKGLKVTGGGAEGWGGEEAGGSSRATCWVCRDGGFRAEPWQGLTWVLKVFLGCCVQGVGLRRGKDKIGRNFSAESTGSGGKLFRRHSCQDVVMGPGDG